MIDMHGNVDTGFSVIGTGSLVGLDPKDPDTGPEDATPLDDEFGDEVTEEEFSSSKIPSRIESRVKCPSGIIFDASSFSMTNFVHLEKMALFD